MHTGVHDVSRERIETYYRCLSPGILSFGSGEGARMERHADLVRSCFSHILHIDMGHESRLPTATTKLVETDAPDSARSSQTLIRDYVALLCIDIHTDVDTSATEESVRIPSNDWLCEAPLPCYTDEHG